MSRKKANEPSHRLVIRQPEIDPVPLEVMAESITAISEGIRALRSTRLNEKALLLLIQHACPTTVKYGPKPGVREIKSVLAGIEALEHEYLKPEGKR